MTPMSKAINGLFKVPPQIKERQKRVDVLRAERDTASHYLDMHRESCKMCMRKSAEELSASWGCEEGRKLADAFREANNAIQRAI